MDYVIQTPGQLSSHLRALRRTRGLSQETLGAALSVGQTRVARIEGNPMSVSVEQLLEVLGALGVQLILRDPALSRGEGTPALKRSSKRPSGSGDW